MDPNSQEFAYRLDLLAIRLRTDPSFLWEQKPESRKGLDMTGINKLAHWLGLGRVIGEINQQSGRTNYYTFANPNFDQPEIHVEVYGLNGDQLKVKKSQVVLAIKAVEEWMVKTNPSNTKERNWPPEPPIIDIALQVLAKYPEWSDKQIADYVGCSSDLLKNDHRFRTARRKINSQQ